MDRGCGRKLGYNVYRSPVSGGGYVKVNHRPYCTTFTDTGLRNAQTYYYVVTALDAAGNESALLERGRARCRTW